MNLNGSNVTAEVLEITNGDGVSVQHAPHPLEALRVRLSAPAAPGELLRAETGTLQRGREG